MFDLDVVSDEWSNTLYLGKKSWNIVFWAEKGDYYETGRFNCLRCYRCSRKVYYLLSVTPGAPASKGRPESGNHYHDYVPWKSCKKKPLKGTPYRTIWVVNSDFKLSDCFWFSWREGRHNYGINFQIEKMKRWRRQRKISVACMAIFKKSYIYGEEPRYAKAHSCEL